MVQASGCVTQMDGSSNPARSNYFRLLSEVYYGQMDTSNMIFIATCLLFIDAKFVVFFLTSELSQLTD